MAKLLNKYKQVRPRTKILAEDYNGLQDAIITSFDSLGDALLESAPAGSRGVSTAFAIGAPLYDDDAISLGLFNSNLAAIGASADLIETRKLAAAASADASNTSAVNSQNSAIASAASAVDSSNFAVASSNSAAAAAATAASFGTAAAADLTTSSTDITAGRVLKVGDFGVGASVNTAITDFNQISATGSYNAASTAANRPPVVESYTIIHTQGGASGRAFQVAISVGSGRVYLRTNFDSTWSAWAESFTSGNSGGIVYGSNANGSYTKFPDGTLICTSTRTRVDVDGAPSGGYYFKRINTPYPLAFTSAPEHTSYLSTDSFRPQDADSITSFNEASLETSPLTLAQNTFVSASSGKFIFFTLIAIGRWK